MNPQTSKPSHVALTRRVRRILLDHGLRPERLEATAVRGYKRVKAGFVTRVGDRGVVIVHRDAKDWLGHPQSAIMRLETIRRILEENGIASTLEPTESNIYPWQVLITPNPTTKEINHVH